DPRQLDQVAEQRIAGERRAALRIHAELGFEAQVLTQIHRDLQVAERDGAARGGVVAQEDDGAAREGDADADAEGGILDALRFGLLRGGDLGEGSGGEGEGGWDQNEVPHGGRLARRTPPGKSAGGRRGPGRKARWTSRPKGRR